MKAGEYEGEQGEQWCKNGMVGDTFKQADQGVGGEQGVDDEHEYGQSAEKHEKPLNCFWDIFFKYKRIKAIGQSWDGCIRINKVHPCDLNLQIKRKNSIRISMGGNQHAKK